MRVLGRIAPLGACNSTTGIWRPYIRAGQHNLSKPLEILAHQEMLVDWFDFWLRGHEDPSPCKVEQYARWEKLRALRGITPD
jgi:hypothetical protein